MFTYATPTYITEAFHLVTQVQLLFMTYIELMPFTALANSYWVSIHVTYQCQGHAHQRYQLQVICNSCRTCLTNHMGSMSHHITILVINSLRTGQTHKHTYKDIRTEIILRN